MADNVTANAGSGGATFRTDDDSTAHWPYVKLAYGPDNTQNIVGSISSNPLPVALSATDNAVLDSIDTAVNGTLTVGSHAVTNAGTFATQVNGDALTALQLIDDPVFADDAAFTTGSSKVMMSGAIRDDSLSTLTAIEGDAVPLRVNSTGALHVTGGGGGTEYSEDAATPATITGTATVMERDDALSSLTPIEGDWAAMRCSAEGALWTQDFNSDAMLALLGTIDTDTGSIATDASTIAGAVAGSEMQVDIVGSLPGGTNAIGKLAANSGVDIGDVDVLSVPNGTSHYRNIDANAESEIKSSGGTLFWMHVMNMTAAVAYLHLYDNPAASVTPGSTTPTYTFPIPTQGDTNGAGFNLPLGGSGQAFANGITLVCTTTLDGSAGDPGTNGVIVNAGYA